MENKSPRRKLTEEERQEAERLNAAWLTYKAQNKGATQTWLAAESGLGTQGAVGQYLRGVIPLNVEALVAICRVIAVDPKTISPRLLGPLLEFRYLSSDEAHRQRQAEEQDFEREQFLAERRATYGGRRAADLTISKGEIEIPQYSDLGGSMGAGLLLRDQPGEIHGWRVTSEWINKNVKNYTAAQNLRIVTGFGDSMRPLYNPGDPLLVDAGVKTVDFDSIYFFRIGDEGFIKRLQRVPGQGLLAISENKSYRDWVIKPEMDFEVFARVIKVWCGSDF